SSIHFSVVKDVAVTETVRLKKIELVNVVNEGTFTENITDQKTYACSPDWEEDATVVSSFVSFTGDITFRETAQYVSSIAAEENAALEAQGQPKAPVSHPLLLIPQTLRDNLTLKITYVVGDEQKTKNVQLNLYPEGTDVSPITEWEIGKRYTYRIVYGTASEFKDIIYFSPETSQWVPVDVIPIIL
ncbi:MAG: fimbrillin family protein, partial [Bacteroidales bacterium]|nr:fimbrillin family protein [Bacteroidales bacterium]